MLSVVRKILFSTKLTAAALFVFAFTIGLATIIESKYGINAARSVVYNATWFEAIFVILTINLIGNIFKYKLYRRQKLIVLLFHVGMIVSIIGAAVTRYYGFEGQMRVREGQSSFNVITEKTYLQFQAHNDTTQWIFDKPLMLNPLWNEDFEYEFDFAGRNIGVKYLGYTPHAIDTAVYDENGEEILELVTVGKEGRLYQYLAEGNSLSIEHLAIGYNDSTFENAIQIVNTDSGHIFRSPYPVHYFVMADQSTGTLSKDTIHRFYPRRLYTINGIKIVFSNYLPKARVTKVTTDKETVYADDILKVRLTCDNETKDLELPGGQFYVSDQTSFEMGGLNFNMSYGSKFIQVPFLIQLDDFRLKRYPGTESPSSFESDITLIDTKNDYKKSHNIFMNNVVDYGGYRFFQSKYDNDEKGSIFSVNYDYWGTLITYIGYGMLFLGMIATLFVKNTRYSFLKKSSAAIRKSRLDKGLSMVALLLLASSGLQAQQTLSEKHNVVDAAHAEKFGRLLILDDGTDFSKGDRTKPIQTFASEFMRKVSKQEKFNGYTPEQVLLSMSYNGQYWQTVPMIYVDARNKEVMKLIGATEKRVPYTTFFDEKGHYILKEEMEKVFGIDEAKHGKYEKEIIALNERVNLCAGVYAHSFYKIFPKEGDTKWYTPNDYDKFEDSDSSYLFVKGIFILYYGAIHSSIESGDWSGSDKYLEAIAKYQKRYGGDAVLSDDLISWEIAYNNVNIFQKLLIMYVIIGPILLVLGLLEVFGMSDYKVIRYGMWSLLAVAFLAHIGGLGLRWYISGHAPWSNAYEAMLFISLVCILAGFIFARNSKLTLASATLIAGTLLMVAHLDWLNPQIGPLVPVLKSYWLMIHVAVITGSYAFLALGSLLGFMALIIIIFRNDRNAAQVNSHIKELTITNEMTITVGVFMATIGTFLGGIWANESWGRYWGWDPKETWALVIVLYFAMVLHLRLIPKVMNDFVFNTFSLLGFGTVLMTFLGVNYYLVGKHSYAGGGSPPVPVFVTYLTVIILLTIAGAGYKYYKKSKPEDTKA